MHITIDGQVIEAQQGDSILVAALKAGIYIPSLCWDARTGKAGRCRTCLVEIEGAKKMGEACATMVREGMVIHSKTEKVLKARRTTVELLLAEGNHNCISCQANGQCELQDLAYSLGIERPSYHIQSEQRERDVSSEGIVRDPDKCIQCGRCVTACQSVVVNEVLGFAYRGSHAKIVCDDDMPMGDSSCVQCGECVEVCPVGALTFKSLWNNVRTWETTATKVTCPYCGVGCQIDLHTKNNRYAYALAHGNNWRQQPNKGMLCIKGRFGLDFVDAPDRLRQPLLRKDGKLTEVSWDEALDFTADRLKAIKAEHGPDSIGFFTSAKVTNEENYSLMKFSRAVIGTNNIDHCARL